MTPYDPKAVQAFYDARAEKEWLRLEKDAVGKLTCAVHEKAIRDTEPNGKRVLELGAGAGRFMPILAREAQTFVTSDISLQQILFNRRKATELGAAPRVAAWLQCDICNVPFASESFDVVICVGGALSYVFDSETQAFGEMLRVLRQGGCLLLGVMCLPGAIRNALNLVPAEFSEQGPEAVEWLLTTGKQDGVNYGSVSGHQVHMMRARDIEALAQTNNALIEKSYCGGFLASAHFDAVQAVAEGPAWIWERLVQAELAFCEAPELLEAGCHMLFRIRKP